MSLCNKVYSKDEDLFLTVHVVLSSDHCKIIIKTWRLVFLENQYCNLVRKNVYEMSDPRLH